MVVVVVIKRIEGYMDIILRCRCLDDDDEMLVEAFAVPL
jgi:hypothetical protein